MKKLNIFIQLILYIMLILLFAQLSHADLMHNEELENAEVTVGWYFENFPLYFGFHAISETEDGETRWVHIEGIPLIITIMEFTSGEDEKEDTE